VVNQLWVFQQISFLIDMEKERLVPFDWVGGTQSFLHPMDYFHSLLID
jgi:hypothetical protein